MRSPALQTLVTAAEAAFTTHAADAASRRSIARAFDALKTVRSASRRDAARLPVCDLWLEKALSSADLSGDLRHLADAFLAVETKLCWQPRSGATSNASTDFPAGHANAILIGPGGIERRSDVWLGVSLLAPGVRYPDHTHPPEETYLVLTPGDFSQDDGPWFQPGPGGSFYNPPGILHAMRAGRTPLFAFWLLLAKDN